MGNSTGCFPTFKRMKSTSMTFSRASATLGKVKLRRIGSVGMFIEVGSPCIPFEAGLCFIRSINLEANTRSLSIGRSY
jgi:hypothetical protein